MVLYKLISIFKLETIYNTIQKPTECYISYIFHEIHRITIEYKWNLEKLIEQPSLNHLN